MTEALETQPPSRFLVYVGDPLCSWCYGFAVPLMATLEQLPQYPVQLVMGGLRAYNTKAMDESMKATIQHHWDQVRERSGQRFGAEAIMARTDFVYDTEPACRAVVAVREHAPALALTMYHAIQQAFYGRGEDVTQAGVLGKVWAGVRTVHQAPGLPGEFDEAAFLTAFDSQAMKDRTRQDFAQTQQWGIGGFPALLAVTDGKAHMVAHGYTGAAELRARIGQVFAE